VSHCSNRGQGKMDIASRADEDMVHPVSIGDQNSESSPTIANSIEEQKCEEWQDITALCKEAAAELGPDEMIHGSHFSLFDAMSALELMDPKMDKPLPALQSLESRIEDGVLPRKLENFSHRLKPSTPPVISSSATDEALLGNETISPAEVLLGVLDGMVVCEIAWHEGGTLPETLYTCLYLHPLAYSALMDELGLGPLPQVGFPKLDLQIDSGNCGNRNTENQGSGSPNDGSGVSSHWSDKALTLALLAHSLGTLRCCSMARDIILLADIYDEEDFNANTYGFRLVPQVEDGAILALLALAERAVGQRVQLSSNAQPRSKDKEVGSNEGRGSGNSSASLGIENDHRGEGGGEWGPSGAKVGQRILAHLKGRRLFLEALLALKEAFSNKEHKRRMQLLSLLRSQKASVGGGRVDETKTEAVRPAGGGGGNRGGGCKTTDQKGAGETDAAANVATTATMAGSSEAGKAVSPSESASEISTAPMAPGSGAGVGNREQGESGASGLVPVNETG
ncbi:unnamed protein product, partial [Choristocarpus tenellus]